VRATQISTPQVGFSQIDLSEFGTPQIGFSQVCSS